MSNITLLKSIDGKPYPGVVCSFCHTPMGLGAIAILPVKVPQANVCVPCLDTLVSLMELDIPYLQPLVEKHNEIKKDS